MKMSNELGRPAGERLSEEDMMAKVGADVAQFASEMRGAPTDLVMEQVFIPVPRIFMGGTKQVLQRLEHQAWIISQNYVNAVAGGTLLDSNQIRRQQYDYPSLAITPKGELLKLSRTAEEYGAPDGDFYLDRAQAVTPDVIRNSLDDCRDAESAAVYVEWLSCLRRRAAAAGLTFPPTN